QERGDGGLPEWQELGSVLQKHVHGRAAGPLEGVAKRVDHARLKAADAQEPNQVRGLVCEAVHDEGDELPPGGERQVHARPGTENEDRLTLDHNFERPRLSSLSASAMTTSFINSGADAYRAVHASAPMSRANCGASFPLYAAS